MDLKEILTSTLCQRPPHSVVADFVAECQKMALVYLQIKTAHRKLHSFSFGVSLPDLALDCIAPIFERDAGGSFVKLQKYFASLNWQKADRIGVKGMVRRLVISTVNQELYRAHKQEDPSLGKLIRNLKHTIKTCDDLIVEERRGERYVSLREQTPTSLALPVMPPEILEPKLFADNNGTLTLRKILSRLARILKDEKVYRQAIPLTELALLIRSRFKRCYELDQECEHNGHDEFRKDDLQRAITLSVDDIKSHMRPSYLAKKKIDEQIYRAYFLAIGDIFSAKYVEDDGYDKSYYDHLCSHLNDLTREDYERKHRCQLEYLAKLTRERLLEMLKKEW